MVKNTQTASLDPFTTFLLRTAYRAGIETPPDPREYDPSNFPYWFVFVNMQKGHAFRISNPALIQANAGVVARLPLAAVMHTPPHRIIERGFVTTSEQGK